MDVGVWKADVAGRSPGMDISWNLVRAALQLWYGLLIHRLAIVGAMVYPSILMTGRESYASLMGSLCAT